MSLFLCFLRPTTLFLKRCESERREDHLALKIIVKKGAHLKGAHLMDHLALNIIDKRGENVKGFTS